MRSPHAALRERAVTHLRLDGSTRDRQALVDRFQAPGGPSVFLISLKAGGTGLNLTAADYVFHTDPWWNPAVEDQATDRAHRIGREHPVHVYRMIASETIEDRVLELQEKKRDLSSLVLGGAASSLSDLDSDDLQFLLS